MTHPTDASRHGWFDEDPKGSSESVDARHGQADDLEQMIDRILDGDVPRESLGEADAPGEAWRDLAMLQQTTRRVREEPVDAPDLSAEILARVHGRRAFASRRTRKRVNGARVAIAAGLLTTLGLFAYGEYAGLGVAVRGDSEPVGHLTASTASDVQRATAELRQALLTWTEPTSNAGGIQLAHASDRELPKAGLRISARPVLAAKAGSSGTEDLLLREGPSMWVAESSGSAASGLHVAAGADRDQRLAERVIVIEPYRMPTGQQGWLVQPSLELWALDASQRLEQSSASPLQVPSDPPR